MVDAQDALHAAMELLGHQHARNPRGGGCDAGSRD